MNHPLLEVKGLAKPPILEQVSFSLHERQTIAITGANSSGKTTIANLITGIVKAESGVILLNGQKLKENNFNQRCRNIRMIFQHAKESINPSVTIGQLLNETLKLNSVMTHQQRQLKIDNTLKLVGLLAEHASFYPSMMSDGQLQRVAIARALILDPQVIIADEPLAALDPSIKSQIVNLLLRLQQQLGIAYIVISHNLAIIRHISDWVLVMKDGKVIEQAATQQLFANPQHEYTQRMIESYNLDALKNSK